MYNLISNAIKYKSPDRKPVVSIRTEKVNGFCLISVKDNGLGLSPEQKEKIFQMFKRFHDHGEGTGIGLYIVKRIVDNAGGKIEVESEKDKGSEFKVYLKTE
jgi:signal transduction histidine kinase